MAADQKGEAEGYFGKYLEDHFKHIDDSVTSIKESIKESIREIRTEVKEIRTEVREIRTEVKEIKAENEKTKLEVKAETTEFKAEVKAEVAAFKPELKEEVAEIKADNRTTRWWMVGTAISVLVGFAAIAVAIFFGFSQLKPHGFNRPFPLQGRYLPNSSHITSY